jgi:uracil-DNA glycosylase family 4
MRNLFPKNTFVPPREGTNLRLAIDEAPGATEAETGIPFSGGSGRWLKVLYGKAGGKESDNSVINCIQCQPENNIFPTDPQGKTYISEGDAHTAVAHCIKAHVEPFLKSRPWERIDTFGDKPLKLILGKSGGVSQWRGTILPVPLLGPEPRAIPTFHPAYIARDQDMLPIVINDLRRDLKIEPEHYDIYPTLDQVRSFRYKRFAFDIECDRWTHAISMVGLSAKPFESLVVPFTGEYINELVRIFNDAEEVIGHNCIQFDLPILANNGVKIRGPKECFVFDTMLAHHLRFPTFPHDLEFVGKQFTNKGAWKSDKQVFETYCARDVDVTWRCAGTLKELLHQAKLEDIYQYVSWPLALICKAMTDAGVVMNGTRLKELRKEYLGKIDALDATLPTELKSVFVTKTRRIPAPAGTLGKSGKPIKYSSEEYQEREYPWKSAPVKAKYLYETLGLPVQKHVKTKKPTVDKGALDKLWLRYKVPELKTLREISKYATLLSSFAKEEYEDSGDVLHGSFNPHGTSTGRLSSSNPNMQNLAIRTRYMFVSRFAGGKLVDGDFSGIENRITAYIANDKDRLEWLKDPTYSEHRYLASVFYEIPYDEVEKSHDPNSAYAICKRICHGTNYCMGAQKIANSFDLDFDLVKKLQSTWKKKIQGTIDWQRRVMDEAKRVGRVENLFGRKLWIWTSGSGPQAVAFHPQSDAAEVIFRSMIGLMYKKINWPEDWARRVCPILCPLPDKVFMIASVHDEILCDSPAELAEETKNCMTTVMTQPWREIGGMVFPISIGIKDSWGDFE